MIKRKKEKKKKEFAQSAIDNVSQKNITYLTNDIDDELENKRRKIEELEKELKSTVDPEKIKQLKEQMRDL